jgi:hypothetical protein
MDNKTNNNEIEKIIHDAAQVAALAAVRQCLSESDKKSRNYAFKNTKILLENYNELQMHVKHSKDSAEDIENDISFDMDIIDEEMDYELAMLNMEPDIFIDSIRRSRCRTIIMIAHIDTCLKILCKEATKAGMYDKYRILKMVYFDGEDIGTVADRFHCSEATARRWLNDMIRRLSILLFGVGAIDLR